MRATGNPLDRDLVWDWADSSDLETAPVLDDGVAVVWPGLRAGRGIPTWCMVKGRRDSAMLAAFDGGPVLILLTTLFALPAGAGSWFSAVGDTTDVGSGGNWARMYDRPDGDYYFLYASSGDYYVENMDGAYELDSTTRRGLTGDSTLVDHAFVECSDGSYVHVASANLDDYDDSAYLFTYDEDLALVDEETVAERDSTHKYNDAPVVCAEDYLGLPFQPYDEDGSEGSDLTGPFRIFDRDLALESTLDFGAYPAVGGSSLILEDDGTVAWIRAYLLADTLEIDRYTDPSTYGSSATELDLIETVEIYVGEEYGSTIGATYWPQSVLKIGDYYVVSFIAADPDLAWSTDTGDVWLGVFDEDWAAQEFLAVTDLTPPDGAAQPFLHWTEGSATLQVMYSVAVQPYVTEVGLEASAFGFTVTSTSRPVADPGEDRTITAGELTTLDGSGSSDADGDTLSYQWSSLEAPSGSSVSDATIDDPTAAVTSFVPDAPGLYRFELTVDDGTYTDSAELTLDAVEGGSDGGATDGGASDGGATDGGATDGGSSDGGSSDGGSSDGGSSDGGSSDGGSSDGGSSDGGSTDGGSSDGGSTTDGGGTADGGGIDTGGEAKDEGCGCSGGGAAGASLLGLLLPLLAVRRRRA